MSTNDKQNDVLSQIHNQETRQISLQTGVFVTGAVEDWEYNGKSGKAGFIQLLIPVSIDTKALKLMRIKVPESRFGTIDLFNKNKQFDLVQLQIEIVEPYNGQGKIKYEMTEDQPSIKAA